MQGLIYALVAAGGAAVWHLIQGRFLGGSTPTPAPGSPAGPAAPTVPAVPPPAPGMKHPFLTYLEEAAVQLGHEVLTNLFQQVLRGGIPGVPVLQPPTIASPAPVPPAPPKS